MAAGEDFTHFEATLKRAAAALREAGIEFALAGSLASWARGGPESRHDLDFLVRPGDAERALAVLEEAGMRPERPPEDWLYKAWDGDVLVDVIFEPSGLDVDEALARAETLSVIALRIPVLALEDLLVTKLMSITEHRLDFSSLLRISRALREQIDWPDVRSRTNASPYARAFFTMLEALDVLPDAGRAAPPAERPRVEVIGAPGPPR